MLQALAKWKAKTPNWASATKLELLANQIKDVTPLASVTALTYLGLAFNQTQDVTPLASLTALTVLYLGNNQIKDVPSGSKRFKKRIKTFLGLGRPASFISSPMTPTHPPSGGLLSCPPP